MKIKRSICYCKNLIESNLNFCCHLHITNLCFIFTFSGHYINYSKHLKRNIVGNGDSTKTHI
jgi:hypothetical protein